ncbi:MAG TPA: hypothetical protein VFX55_17320 [Duganella sp.]|nr:hypothetical protein [Duganella sp.]
MLALAWGAQAAELGDITPRSYIGQPLAVDIDLVALTPEEALNLPVRLAQADVYRGANTAMNPALSSVRMQVEKRGQKQILHVTTTRPVEADYLHIYVELGVPGKSDVRLATVWLQRDPNPPPAPAPVQVAAVTPAAPPVPASAMTPAQAEQITAQARAARAEAARAEAAKAEAAKAELAKAEAARERTKPAPLPSVHEAETGKPGEIKAAGQARRIAGVLVGSDGKPVVPSARAETAEVPVGVSQALLPLAPLPLPKGVKRPAPASCAPTGMSAKECVALDARNTEMASKITELEGKLKALQGALVGGAAPAAAAGPVAKPGVPAGTATAAAANLSTKPGAPAGSASAKPDAVPAATRNGAAEKPGGSSSAGEPGGKAGGKGAASAQASASLSAQGETEAHAAKAAGASASASAASGEAAAAAASLPTKQVRVLPKLKYKKEKEKPAEQSSSTLPMIAAGVGLLALLGGGFIVLRKRSTGKGPLKIWQGFRKKKADEPSPQPAAEPAPESVA